jgi:UDP:flavonoid glycosyltransferase YjiC (YdhE family)
MRKDSFQGELVNPKKSILFVSEAVNLAHVIRPLVLAQSLDAQEYDVHFACDVRYQSLISATPHIQYWPIRSIPSRTFLKAVDRGGFVLQKRDIKSYVNQELELFTKTLPSLIVGDLRHTLSISSELSHHVYAALTNAYWSPYRILDFNPVPELPMVALINKRTVAKLMPWKEQSATASFNKVRKTFGLPLLKNFLDLATRADYALYAEPPGFIQTMPLPENHLFLGPVLWSPDSPKPTWWKAWNPNLPLIYITLGSTGAVRRLPDILRALRDLPMTIVVATAGRVRLKNMPQNVYVADYLPGMETCGLASVVVCNGGSTTAYQALSHGIPVVGIWSNIDQYLSIRAIEHAGAGVCCSAYRVNPKKLQDTILSVLKDSRYRARAAELGETFRTYDACRRFQEFVHEVTGTESPARIRKGLA